jgi:hypothetical protein
MRAERLNFLPRLDKAGFRLNGDIFGAGTVGPLMQLGKRK